MKLFLLRHAGWADSIALAFVVAALGGALAGWWRVHFNAIGWVLFPVGGVWLFNSWASWQREQLIREGPLPQFLKRKLRETYPHLSGKDAELVERGLRQYVMACKRSKRQFVAMPSRAVDALWHEFILNTEAYKNWCQLSLGRFLHHTPAEVLGRKAASNDGLRRAWYWACKDEAIDPRKPSRLPLLFALDGKLGIEGGFTYVPDCSGAARRTDRHKDGDAGSAAYCGGSFSDGSASGDAGDFGGAESSGGGDDGGGSGDGGGDGGGGCGGGD